MTAPRDEGLAAVELGILVTLFIPMLALVAPLAYLYYEDLQLGRTAGDVVRFASSRAEQARTVDDPGPPAATFAVARLDLPSVDAIRGEARRAYTGAGRATLVSFRSEPNSTSGCPSGRRVTIELQTTVDVGPFAGLLITNPTKTLTARASSCEE